MQNTPNAIANYGTLTEGASRYLNEHSAPARVLDMDAVENLVRMIYHEKILEDPTKDQSMLDVSFFDNSSVQFTEFNRNIGFGQVMTYFVKEEVNPLDGAFSRNLTYKNLTDHCGGQLDLDCSIPCGGIAPSYRQGTFELSREYVATAQRCRKTEPFVPFDEFMTLFDKAVEGAKLNYALDVWNKLVDEGVATKAPTLDAGLKTVAPVHYLDASDEAKYPIENWIGIVKKIKQYMEFTYKGTFGVFVPEEFANTTYNSALANGLSYANTGVPLTGYEFGKTFAGMSEMALPSIFGGDKFNIIPRSKNFFQAGKDLHPLYDDNGNMYIVIASRDAMAHTTIEGGTHKENGTCGDLTEKIAKWFFAGFKTVFPEKVFVIKVAVPEFSLETALPCVKICD